MKSFQYFIKEKIFPKPTCGSAEEFLISLLLKYNKFKVKNLNNFEEEIEIKEINNLKDNSVIDYFKRDFSQNGNILISQDFNGENYELLIIVEINGEDYAIFIQIGVDKNEQQIIKKMEELNQNYTKYMNNLNYLSNRNISYINLLFIFDEKNQESKIHKKDAKSCGSKICENLKIDYLWYSLESDNLFSISFDEQNNFKKKIEIIEYIPKKFVISKNISINEKPKINLFSETKPLKEINCEQKLKIEEIINNIFKNNYKISWSTGKNYQICIPTTLLKKVFDQINDESIPCAHIFSCQENNAYTIILLVDNILYSIEDKGNERIINRIDFSFVTWDIYKLYSNK